MKLKFKNYQLFNFMSGQILIGPCWVTYENRNFWSFKISYRSIRPANERLQPTIASNHRWILGGRKAFSKIELISSEVANKKGSNLVSALREGGFSRASGHRLTIIRLHSSGDSLSSGRHQGPVPNAISIDNAILSPLHCPTMGSSKNRQQDFNPWKINQDLILAMQIGKALNLKTYHWVLAYERCCV